MRLAFTALLCSGCTAFVDADLDRLGSAGGDAAAEDAETAARDASPDPPIGPDAGADTGPCREPECAPGQKEDRPCEGGGTEHRVCSHECRWAEWSACAVCETGAIESEDCGDCHGERQRVCDETGRWSPWSDCKGADPEPEREERRTCGLCGTQVRTTGGCAAGGWSECRDEGECAPGEVRDGPCDRCAEQRCGDDCSWGDCTLREGAACEHREGTNYRCCGESSWQFCLPECVWSEYCDECDGCCGSG